MKADFVVLGNVLPVLQYGSFTERRWTPRSFRSSRWVQLLLLSVCLAWSSMAPSQDIPAPIGSSVSFGTTVKVLPNGNFLVTDPNFSVTGGSSIGAVYLYRPDRSLISRLTGTRSLDRVGRGQVLVLPNSNVVLVSDNWDNDKGAVTFLNGAIGLNGEVSAANSLVGTTADDRVGGGGVDLLSNGNYIVASPRWDSGSTVDAGAATWGSANQGVVGPVTDQNSLIGASSGDLVSGLGSVTTNGVVPLSNGNYVITSPSWDNGPVADVGAVTWGNGGSGVTGIVSSANSLIGASAGDLIGSQSTGASAGSVVPLSNGNYVVASINWDNGGINSAGAVTWCDGTSPTVGVVGISNSLVGSSTNDRVGEIILPLRANNP